MLKRYSSLLVLFILNTSILAETPPNHKRVLFDDNLQAAGVKEFGEIIQNRGAFISGQGWQTTGSTSQLIVKMAEYMPFEGTLEVTMTNLDPVSQVNRDWFPISIWSSDIARLNLMNATSGSYLTIKIEDDPSLISGGKAAWKLVATPFWGNGPDHQIVAHTVFREYEKSNTYVFKLVWTPQKAWLVVNNGSSDIVNEMISFKDQIENFEYIYLGKNNSFRVWVIPNSIADEMEHS